MSMEASAPGDSRVQREAEALIREALAARLRVALAPARFDVGDGGHIDIDAFSEDPPVLAEIWAHQGRPRPAQKAKVITDALKLLWLSSTRSPAARKILVLADEEAARHFRGRGTWIGCALEDLGIEVLVMPIPDEARARILEAQTIQKR